MALHRDRQQPQLAKGFPLNEDSPQERVPSEAAPAEVVAQKRERIGGRLPPDLKAARALVPVSSRDVTDRNQFFEGGALQNEATSKRTLDDFYELFAQKSQDLILKGLGLLGRDETLEKMASGPHADRLDIILGILFDKNALAAGKPTSITGHMTMSDFLSGAKIVEVRPVTTLPSEALMGGKPGRTFNRTKRVHRPPGGMLSNAAGGPRPDRELSA